MKELEEREEYDILADLLHVLETLEGKEKEEAEERKNEERERELERERQQEQEKEPSLFSSSEPSQEQEAADLEESEAKSSISPESCASDVEMMASDSLDFSKIGIFSF